MSDPKQFHWNSRPLEARLDLSDKDAVYAKLDSAPLRPGINARAKQKKPAKADSKQGYD